MLEKTNVVPDYQAGKKNLVKNLLKNCRPITLLMIFSKIIQRVILTHLFHIYLNVFFDLAIHAFTTF